MKSKVIIDGIKQFIDRIGIDNLSDSHKVLAYFADLYPFDKTERNALKFAYDSGAMKTLLSAKNGSLEAEYAVIKAVADLKDNVLMDENIAKQLVNDLCRAMGLPVPESKPKAPQESSAPSKPNTPKVAPPKTAPQTATPTKTPSQTATPPKIATQKSGTAPKIAPITPPSPPKIAPVTVPTSKPVPRRRRKSIDFPWLPVLLITGSILALGVTLGLSFYSWQIGQWPVGILLGVGAIGLTIYICIEESAYLPQMIGMGILSVVNVLLAWLFPEQCSTMAFLIAFGFAAAYFACSVLAYADLEEDYGIVSTVLMACNLAVALSVQGGMQSILLWLGVYLVPALIIAATATSIYEKLDGDNGIVISSITAGIIIGAHILLVCLCPHFVHSLHGYPELLDKEFGTKQAVCYCGEQIEVGNMTGDFIHGYTCEHHDLWNPLKDASFKSNEDHHWFVCKCGFAFGAVESYYDHEYENGVCKVCGYEQEQ